MRNKKAQSMIITSILIILLVMVSVVVLWNVVFLFLGNAEEEMGLDSFLLMGEVEYSQVEEEKVRVVVERKSGGGEIEGVKLIFKDSSGQTYVYDSDEYPDELETEVYNIEINDVEGLSDFEDVESVSVHFIYSGGKVTPELDVDEVGSCNPDNFCVEGVCGNIDNGCEEISCGCDDGFSCNVQGRCAIPGLVGWWEFEDNFLDSAGDNDGVNVNDGVGFEAGKAGKAGSFDGVDDYVQVLDSGSLNLVEEMTLSSWVYPTQVTGSRRNIIYASSGYLLDLNEISSEDYGRIGSFIHNGAWQFATQDGGNVNLNEWTLISATYDGSKLINYVNGEWVGELVVSGDISDIGSIVIGSNPLGTTQFFQGQMDELMVFNRALSDDEMKLLHDSYD